MSMKIRMRNHNKESNKMRSQEGKYFKYENN